jgi:acetyl esterase/lipase
VTDDAMGWAARIDPETRSVLDGVPRLDLTDIATARRERAALAARAAARHVPPAAVRTEDRCIPGWPEGEPDVVVRVHEPVDLGSSPVPALLWVHGGGHVLGAAAQDDPLLQDLVARTGCVAVAVEWRRAPEDPYPAALHDAYAALRWMAAEPWVDDERLVVGGASSGGGVAAGTALLARDRAEIALAGQVLVYPMLDDRELTASSVEVRDPRLWNHESNRLGWAAYLSGLDGTAGGVRAEVPGYAAPARVTDLRGLPPTWLATGALDLFRDEDIEYAARLYAAAVPTELHVYPGAVHGFDVFAPDAAMSVRYRRERDDALDRFVGTSGGGPRGMR